MRGTTTLLLAVLNTISAAKPLRNRDLAKFPAGSVFDIVLQRSKVSDADLKGAKGTVIDVDLEDNYRNGAKTTIGDLAKVKTVICYFSAGSYENWRSDKDKFLPSDYGKNMTWPGENWINVKSDNVKKIMAARIEQAAKAGCHAVDPDNVDGFVGNQDGFGYDSQPYIDYIKWLSDTAHSHGLAMGLKNAIEIIPDVIDSVEFAVNEQCHTNALGDGTANNECSLYAPFTVADKAVYNIEYGGNDCSKPVGVNLSTVIKLKDQGLDNLGGQCP